MNRKKRQGMNDFWVSTSIFERLCASLTQLFSPWRQSSFFSFTGKAARTLSAILFVCLLLGFAADIVWVYSMPVWYDEVGMVEPAWQMAVNQKFASNCLVSSGIYAWNYPLHIGALTLLIKCFGLNFYLIRSFSLVCTLLGLYVIVRTMVSKRWLCTPLDIMVFMSCVVLSSITRVTAAQARPECLTFLLVSLIFSVVVSNRNRVGNRVLLFILSMFIPWCGLHMVVPAGLFLSIVWFFGGLKWNRIGPMLLGICSGIILLFLWYFWTGTFQSFLFEGSRAAGKINLIQRLYGMGYTFANETIVVSCSIIKVPFICLAIAFVLFSTPDRLRNVIRGMSRPQFFLTFFVLLVPFVVDLTSNWLGAYGWMCFLPFAVVTTILWRNNAYRFQRVFHFTLLLLIVFLGAETYQLAHTIQAEGKSHWKLGFLSETFSRDKPAVTDFSCYYWARRYAKDWYAVSYVVSHVEGARQPTSLRRPSNPVLIPDDYRDITIVYPGQAVSTVDKGFAVIIQTLDNKLVPDLPLGSIKRTFGWMILDAQTDQIYQSLM